MLHNKDKPANLHTRYKKTLEASFVAALLILCSLFFAFQKHESSFELPMVKIDKPIISIPITKQLEKLKPKPSRPIPAPENEEEKGLEPDEILESLFNPPKEIAPPPDDEDIGTVLNIWELSKKPELKFKAIPKYPELPRKAGIEGRVIVEVIISKRGDVIAAKIISGVKMLNDAALEAAKKCKFYPAMQRDKYVKVRMSIPFDFRLH